MCSDVRVLQLSSIDAAGDAIMPFAIDAPCRNTNETQAFSL
jgi:hypothetical protein